MCRGSGVPTCLFHEAGAQRLAQRGEHWQVAAAAWPDWCIYIQARQVWRAGRMLSGRTLLSEGLQ